MVGGHRSDDGEVFSGVRFVLFGFDSVSEAQYRSELVRRGGAVVGRYDSSCTHVIVSGRVYDDPVCIAARNDGKILVTELWIEDSVDFATLADSDRILYRPVRDLNGIPGSESLFICLTGYQRQARDDIMKMVDLMGAYFSKPLIATKVTHLICYKFEGEKYELAKRVNIKLVNHRWLEDCLKAWEIISTENYRKSGWELEIMEAEARDSNEETEENSRVQQLTGRNKSAENSGQSTGLHSSTLMLSSPKTLVPAVEALTIQQEDTVPLKFSSAKFENFMDSVSLSTCKESNSARSFNMLSNCIVSRNLGTQDGKGTINSGMKEASLWNSPILSDNPVSLNKEANFGSGTRSFMTSDAIEVETGSLSYSRKNPRRSVSAEDLAKRIGLLDRSSPSNDVPSLALKQDVNDIQLTGIQSTATNTDLCYMEEPCSELPQKRKVSNFSSVSSAFGHSDISPIHNSLTFCVSAKPEIPLVSVACQGESDCHLNDVKNHSDVAVRTYPTNQERGSLILKSTVFRNFVKHESASRSNDGTCLKGQLLDSYHNAGSTVSPHDHRGAFDGFSNFGTWGGSHSPIGCKLTNLQHDCEPAVVKSSKKSIRSNVDNLGSLSIDRKGKDALQCKVPETYLCKTSELSRRPDDEGDIPITELSNILTGVVGQARKPKEEGSLSCSSKDSEMGKLSNPANPSCKASAKTLIKKVVSKKKLSCRSEPSAENNSNGRSSMSSNEVVSPNESTLRTKQEIDKELEQNGSNENNDMLGTVAKDEIMKDFAKEGQNSASKSNLIGIHKDRGANLNEKNSSGESDLKSKEIKEPVLKETPIDETNGMIKSSPDDALLRRKMKKVHRRLNNHHTKNVSTAAMQVPNDSEKENEPAGNVSINRKMDKHEGRNMKVKCGGNSGQNRRRIVKTTNSQCQNHQKHRVISDQAWFILSGHRPQRKEFQMVIRRLRGRLCRDSHNWSYQATHLIVPDPIRRTEKFFAAVSSGRWVLKTDYLTASNEAVKLLDEEPFEWYDSVLTEDGAINLEAPRKWRRLRERTGHGAFYGMRIISYGEFIAPSLDTLKRVIKAGDGMILTTSPPYTRFLKSGLDFVVIGPGIPHVDTWIQEFLRHEIPCVSPDYLVEYVCKPDYPLGRHVLYETHAWAEKSLAKLLSKSEEIVKAEDRGTLSEDPDDLSCSVCGSRERGDVMLICGDEGESAGCGIGTHIDCCDPPLEAVPEEDWFCPNCSRRGVGKAPVKGRRR